MKFSSLFVPAVFHPNLHRAENILLETAGSIQGNRLYKPHRIRADEETVKFSSLFLPAVFHPNLHRAENILLETTGSIQGNRLYKPCVCIEAGLGRCRNLHFTGLSGPKIGILPSSENTDFKRISSILLSLNRPWATIST